MIKPDQTASYTVNTLEDVDVKVSSSNRAVLDAAYEDGKLVLKEFPESLLRRFKREGVDNPLLCSLLNQQLGKDADREVET